MDKKNITNIRSKTDYRYFLEADRLALGRKGKRPWLFYMDPIWSFERLLRKVEYYNNCRKDFIGKLYLSVLKFRLRKMCLLLGFSIPVNTIGPGLAIVHAGPVIIGRNVKIGSNLRINVGVVIGENKSAESFPTIGNNVVIEPGAKIFGKIEIADWIHIGANAVVNKSFVEPGIVIAGVPAKKIKVNENYLIHKGET